VAVAISPDGKWLVTGSGDNTARIWPLRIEEVLDQAERAVGRNFTREEWKELFPDELYRKTFERLPAPPEEPPPPG
jgi:WD40 repeat protein